MFSYVFTKKLSHKILHIYIYRREKREDAKLILQKIDLDSMYTSDTKTKLILQKLGLNSIYTGDTEISHLDLVMLSSWSSE